MKKKRTPKPRVAMHLPKHVPDRIRAVRTTTAAVRQNQATFPGSLALLDKTDADLDELEKREAAVKTGPHGSADLRDEQLRVVDADAGQIVTVVQQRVDADPEHAPAIAAQAALQLARSRSHGPQQGALHDGETSGAIKVTMPSQGRAAYNVQVSLDGGKTWSEPLLTDVAHATFTGLPVGATALVRWRFAKRGVMSDWSAPMSIVVR